MKPTITFVLLACLSTLIGGVAIGYALFNKECQNAPRFQAPVLMPTGKGWAVDPPVSPFKIVAHKAVTPSDTVRKYDSLPYLTNTPVTPKVTFLKALLSSVEDTTLKPSTVFPPFSIEKPAMVRAGFTFSHDFLTGGYAGGVLARARFGESFSLFTEIGFFRSSFETQVGVEILPWIIIQ